MRNLNRLTWLSLFALFLVCTLHAEDQRPQRTFRDQHYDEILDSFRNLSYEQFRADSPRRLYLEQLSFDPTKATYYPAAAERLQLNKAERDIFAKRGFVSVDHGQRYSFGAMYYAIYTRDLPVLVTTDSILHAMHRSYGDVLMHMEQHCFGPTIGQVLATCHDELAAIAKNSDDDALENNYRDIDLYLTVARNLMAGAGAPKGEKRHALVDQWNGVLIVNSVLGQDEAAIEILEHVQSLRLQGPIGPATFIYGTRRKIDYSQFKPRGHYTKTVPLRRYFRTMMWLGRADTGMNLLPAESFQNDDRRELRNAVLLTELLAATDSVGRLRQIDHILRFMVGAGDNLTVFDMVKLLEQQDVRSVADVASDESVQRLQNALRESDIATQRIRSQVLVSNPHDSYEVPPPALFQMFGQRYVIDSLVLSKVIYDSILFHGEKQFRMIPSGMDVMCALGNTETMELLKPDIRRHHYAANLKAAQMFVEQHRQPFWQQSLYNLWLDALRTLDDDLSDHAHYPQVMRTRAWQRKQLQTQLASWSELRHDTVLYAKQSYTAGILCEYPAGYVEPYPEFYSRIGFFAREAARRIAVANFAVAGKQGQTIKDLQKRQVTFFERMAGTMRRLETLARKELSAEPFSEDEKTWLKKTVDRRGRGSGPPRYDGWYPGLFYGGGARCEKWEPTIVDVHTNPNSLGDHPRTVLESGVGNCNFLIAAIDSQDDHMVFVGPAYSYYEFLQPVEDRLTDKQWQSWIDRGNLPERPAWTADFQGPMQKRTLPKEELQKRR